MTPLWSRSASWLARPSATEQVSGLEVVDACLARIDEVNPRINAVVRLADDARERARDRRHGRSPGAPSVARSTASRSRSRTRSTRPASSRRRARSAGATASRSATRRSSRGCAARAGSCSARRTRPSSPGPTRPTTTSTAGRRTRTTSIARPAAAAAARRRSSPRAARRSTSAATAATRSASPAHLCGVAGIKPTSGRVPRTGHWPGPGGLFESFTQLGPIARRVEDLELVLPIIAGPDGEDPHVAPVPLGDPGSVQVAGPARRVVRRQRDPDADARDDRGGAGGGRRDRGDRGTGRGACPARHRRRPAGLGGRDPRRRVRLAVAPHRGRPARPATAPTTRSAGSRRARASRSPATR